MRSIFFMLQGQSLSNKMQQISLSQAHIIVFSRMTATFSDIFVKAQYKNPE